MYSDHLFIFRDKKVLVRKGDGESTIPLFSNITPYWPEVSDYARYLFSIDSDNFFLVDESKANIVLPSEYGLENITVFRTMTPKHMGFARELPPISFTVGTRITLFAAVVAVR